MNFADTLNLAATAPESMFRECGVVFVMRRGTVRRRLIAMQTTRDVWTVTTNGLSTSGLSRAKALEALDAGYAEAIALGFKEL
jgi:hypothetical protein